MDTIDLIKDVCLFGGGIPSERIDEIRAFFDNYQALQLHKTQVIESVCEYCGKGKPTCCDECFDKESQFRQCY